MKTRLFSVTILFLVSVPFLRAEGDQTAQQPNRCIVPAQPQRFVDCGTPGSQPYVPPPPRAVRPAAPRAALPQPAPVPPPTQVVVPPPPITLNSTVQVEGLREIAEAIRNQPVQAENPDLKSLLKNDEERLRLERERLEEERKQTEILERQAASLRNANKWNAVNAGLNAGQLATGIITARNTGKTVKAVDRNTQALGTAIEVMQATAKPIISLQQVANNTIGDVTSTSAGSSANASATGGTSSSSSSSNSSSNSGGTNISPGAVNVVANGGTGGNAQANGGNVGNVSGGNATNGPVNINNNSSANSNSSSQTGNVTNTTNNTNTNNQNQRTRSATSR